MTIKKITPESFLVFSLLSLLVLTPTLAYADDDDEAEDIAENLGWVAVGQE